MSDSEYVPPEVWTWDKESGGRFASINRPVSGPKFEKDLPRGKHPLQLHSMGTPNGQKVTILLEELLALGHEGAEYDAWMVDILEGEQFSSGFVSINPNSKIPALLDVSGDAPIRVFESGAILLYLAEKFDAFVPKAAAQRAECYSWLMWQMGSAPMIGGGFGHFFAYAPEKYEYAINRFSMETKRLFDVADKHLADNEYLAGSEYSIADMALYGWFGMFVNDEGYENGPRFLDIPSYRNVVRWVNLLDERDGVKRGRIVNRDGEKYLRERHDASDIDAVLARQS
ncbi:thiol:disulfide oxidoreductase [Novosphingobium marinum]|uniref:GST-like protein n=1 Tax=Novosphingobium marinum TaxID=1514948 RepID=A0A7Y9XXN6_9SPHN|nr:glutathione-dependent disulfide-bond oxidoreductase [Novosphingobium marinum]NYH96489.1 GST-like protein [Novosphingobium marinum]GGC35636.1 thiol:disulfide oxidoreductase [Novosphingobium marinum]